MSITRQYNFDFSKEINSKDEIFLFLDDFIKYIKIKGKYAEYSPVDFLNKMKQVRINMGPQWNKEIAHKFGGILKLSRSIFELSTKIYNYHNNN